MSVGFIGGSCDYGNEPTGFVEDKEFLDQLSDSQFLKDILHGVFPFCVC
jgi:hypothetical protein